ncbi:hypothetical protein GJ744_008723 [Endocarpon pusillum]|uniref:Uncharacterized protein n=1 Tax=Endocarpon pusillum TaxID=364733 RepID=A0A8H7DY53_9EURO|nr:hypothetical protein GJ744_008723 [Endocarpon pusillum]
MTRRTDWDLPADDSEHEHQESMFDEILRVASSGGEKQQEKTVTERGRTPGATGVTQKKTTGGTAAIIYKEMRDVTKRGDVMTWKGKESFLVEKETIEGWLKQLAKLRDASERVVTDITDLQKIAIILRNTEEIKRGQAAAKAEIKSYSQAAASSAPIALTLLKLQPIKTKRKEVKVIILETKEKEKSNMMNTKIILNVI